MDKPEASVSSDPIPTGGSNGAGKSTLMKILVGAYQPDSGSILLDGEEVRFSHPRQAQERGVSIIYQEFLRCAGPRFG